MLFNSFVFAGLFLPLTLLLFWGMPTPGAKRAVLLLSSLVFYGYWFPWYLLLLVGFVAVAWWCALQVETSAGRWPVWVAAVLLLGGLGYYKYAGFLGQVATDLGLADHGFRIQTLALPLGISFIVFQALGYVVDVYRREFPAERSFAVVLLFKAFFPQLIAGPICRAHELMPQLRGNFTFRLDQFTSGLAIFALGLLLKEFFADGLAPLVNQLYTARPNYLFHEAWAASIGFGGQIYADFWGYSTMAVGLARMFGIVIPVNFNLPYLATSLREFWRRWHITLSQWLRDYLYKPLGGSRHGPNRTVLALMLTMLLGGLWHGANYTFIIWGAIHGLALVLEHVFGGRQLRARPGTWSPAAMAGWTYTFLVVFVAWVYFRATDVGQANQIVGAMFSPARVQLSALSLEIRQITFLVAVLVLVQWPVEWLLGQLRRERLAPAAAVTVAFWSLIGALVLGAPVAVPFIYFQF
jgi:alginate O-acetyltransferase complex protein AlgI